MAWTKQLQLARTFSGSQSVRQIIAQPSINQLLTRYEPTINQKSPTRTRLVTWTTRHRPCHQPQLWKTKPIYTYHNWMKQLLGRGQISKMCWVTVECHSAVRWLVILFWKYKTTRHDSCRLLHLTKPPCDQNASTPIELALWSTAPYHQLVSSYSKKNQPPAAYHLARLNEISAGSSVSSSFAMLKSPAGDA